MSSYDEFEQWWHDTGQYIPPLDRPLDINEADVFKRFATEVWQQAYEQAYRRGYDEGKGDAEMLSKP